MPRIPASQPVKKETKIGSHAVQVICAVLKCTMGGILILCRDLCHSMPVASLSTSLPAAIASRSLRHFLATSAKTIQAIMARRPRYIQRTTGPTIPIRSSHMIIWAPISKPTTVPTSMIIPSL